MCKSSRSLGRGSSLPWRDKRVENHISSEKQLKSRKGDVHKPCVPAGSQMGCQSQDALRRLMPLEPRLAEHNAELAPLAKTLWPGSCGQVADPLCVLPAEENRSLPSTPLQTPFTYKLAAGHTSH